MQEMFRQSSMIRIRLDDYKKDDVDAAKENVQKTLKNMYEEV